MESKESTYGSSSSFEPSSFRGSRQEGSAQARSAAEEAQRGVRSVGEAGLRWFDSFFASRRDAASEGLCGIASALRTTARTLTEQDQERASRFASAAAERLDALSDSLRESELEDVLRPLQRVARRQPAVLVGGALAFGFVVARVLKSARESGLACPSGVEPAGRDDSPRTSSAEPEPGPAGAGITE